jgi:hypothetical protein
LIAVKILVIYPALGIGIRGHGRENDETFGEPSGTADLFQRVLQALFPFHRIMRL